MEVTERELRERYQALDTDSLIGLLRDGGLTDMATGLLKQVLAARGISGSQLESQLPRPPAAKSAPIPETGPGKWTRTQNPTLYETPQDKVRKYKRRMLSGLAWGVGGAIVTAVTYSAASSNPGGGTYVVAGGAIVFGIYDFFAGLFGLMRHAGAASASEPPIDRGQGGTGFPPGQKF
jgi:hypothetical protein